MCGALFTLTPSGVMLHQPGGGGGRGGGEGGGRMEKWISRRSERKIGKIKKEDKENERGLRCNERVKGGAKGGERRKKERVT